MIIRIYFLGLMKEAFLYVSYPQNGITAMWNMVLDTESH